MIRVGLAGVGSEESSFLVCIQLGGNECLVLRKKKKYSFAFIVSQFFVCEGGREGGDRDRSLVSIVFMVVNVIIVYVCVDG